jgi:hypothetical protein
MAVLFLKKFMIYTLTLTKVVEEFLLYKTQQRPENVYTQFFKKALNASKLDKDMDTADKLPIDKRLINKSLQELTDLVDIECLQIYIFLSNIFISKKEKAKKISFIYKNHQYEFLFKMQEQEKLLCCKVKRKDELIKFTFKFIRRQIMKDFTNKHKKKLSYSQLKLKFYSAFLNSDKKAIKYFESFDVSKKGLLILEPFTELSQLINDFKSNQYMHRVMEEYIMVKVDPSIKNSIPFRSFVEESLSRQHKQSLVVQNILNSLEIFEEFLVI